MAEEASPEVECEPLAGPRLQHVAGEGLKLAQEDDEHLKDCDDHEQGDAGAHDRSRQERIDEPGQGMGIDHGVDGDLERDRGQQQERRRQQLDEEEQRDLAPERCDLAQDPAGHTAVVPGCLAHYSSRSPIASRAAAMPMAHSWSSRATSKTAAPPTMAAAAQAPLAAAAVQRTPTKKVETMPALDNLGQRRTRASCLPPPCSSTATRSRAEPSGPPRTSRSQRSYSPPRMTAAPPSRTAVSRELGAARPCSSARSRARASAAAAPRSGACPADAR